MEVYSYACKFLFQLAEDIINVIPLSGVPWRRLVAPA
jgi:hypothetical protein